MIEVIQHLLIVGSVVGFAILLALLSIAACLWMSGFFKDKESEDKQQD